MNDLEKLTAYIREYDDYNLQNGHGLNQLLQKVTALLYYLETMRSEAHDEFQTMIFKLTEKGKSVARAENEAHVMHPEMYKLRRILDAGYRVADSIRTNISFLKFELTHSQQ